MASKDLDWTHEHTNYSRLVRIVVELLRDVLWQLLTSKIPEKDISKEVARQQSKLNRHKHLLSRLLTPRAVPCSTDFDISALYVLLRHICPKLKAPTRGWFDEAKGNYPTQGDIKTGDDIERIRMVRKEIQGHVKEAKLSDNVYSEQLSEITFIVKRMDGRFGNDNNNFKFLLALQSCNITDKEEEDFVEQLMKEWEFDETTRVMAENLTGRVDQLTVQADCAHERTCTLHSGLKSVSKKVKKQKRKVKQIQDVQRKHTDTVDHLAERTEVCEDEIKDLKSKETNKDGVVGATNITLTQIHYGDSGHEGDVASLTKGDSATVNEMTPRQTYAAVTASNIQSLKEKEISVVHYTNQVNITVNNGGQKSSSNTHNPLQSDPNSKRFLTATKHLNDGHYILITGDTKRNKFLEPLALVPWVAVFDFDSNSRSTGLLSVVEDKLTEYNRSLHINCLEDENLNNINENSTHWMFCRGCRENSNSKESYSYDEWQHDASINSGLKSFCKMLINFANAYTKYTAIVLLQNQDDVAEFVHRLMTKLKKYLRADFVLVKSETQGGETCSFIEQMILHQFKDCLTTVSLDIKDMCETVANCFSDICGKRRGGIDLPTMDKQNKVDIDAKQMAWLEEDLTVLYGNKQYDPSGISQEMLEKECDNFFKGGTLPWYVWYEVDAGHVDVKRDLTDAIISTITTRYIHKYTSGLVTLYHAPGCGGTTLAQRILWEMKRQTPCAQEKLRSNSTVQDLVSRLEFLYEKTSLPIVLLTDGEDCQRVNHLLRCVKKAIVIILFVRRYANSMSKHKNTIDTFWLGSYVSISESKVLAMKFSKQCSSEEKKKAIGILADEVKQGNKKSIYEFGLAAYSYEYRGLENYVRGYLKLQSKRRNIKTTLDPWHHVLAMLSLAWYYGHIGIACKFFTEIPNIEWKTTRNVPTLEDFPENLQSLIVKDETENRSNIIRVSNFFVAKEILEQLLPWPNPRPDLRNVSLCVKDKMDLQRLTVDFIKHAAKVDRGEHDSTVVKILTRIFIIREKLIGRQESGNELNAGRTNKISQVFQDLYSMADYSELFAVMTQLTQSFPKDPHFFAHLGRLYTLFKPAQEREAESNFNKALQLCEKLTKGQEIDQMTYHMRISFSITHFMYANMYRRRMAGFTCWSQKQKIRQHSNVIDKADKLLKLTEVARARYQDSRKYDPDVYNKIYAFVHEIHVCLMFCDFLLKNGGYPDIIHFINKNDTPVSRFADECIYEIDELFLEFFSTVEPEDVDDTVREYQKWYLALFKDMLPTHERILIRKDSIHANRIQIAAIKLRYGSETNIYSSLEDIQFEREMLDIITHYEYIFADVHERGFHVKVTSLEQDYREWLIAIRSKLITEPYTIEKVLENVNMWESKLHTPMSKFYQFVLKSILGFGSEDSIGNTHNLIEAQQLKQDVTKYRHVLLKIRYPKEWLGRGQGIQQMLYGARFFGGVACRSDQDRCPGYVQREELALMKGTIKHPNSNPRAGFISLDLGKTNNVSVDVFFVPINFKMNFKAFAQVRVEFNIGFTFANGYEAYNIKQLQKITCTGCRMDVEVTSRDSHVICQCGEKLTPAVKGE